MVFLLITKLNLNKKLFNIIKIILIFANFRKKTNLLRRLKDNKMVYLAIKKTSILKQIYKKIIKI